MLRAAGFGIDKGGLTEYLLYVGEQELGALTQACLDYWDAFAALGGTVAEAGRGRQAKSAASAGVPAEVKNRLLAALDGGKAADLALFGRMLADLPQKNVDAAAQVAHAISTNKVAVEFDFYTAVDDFRPDDTEGAGMMGTVEFNSACFYRYANVDLRQLAENLGDAELVDATVEAFLHASVSAIPTGKQHSMAAQNPPSLVLAVVRRSGLWNLANAFVEPVTPGRDGDLVETSILRLAEHWDRLSRMFGTRGLVGTAVAALADADLGALADGRVQSIDELVARVRRLRADAAAAGIP
jgi:CRISPR system Cascade subunit CasC